MKDQSNSVTYDADRDELKIVTQYTERQYTDIHLRDMYAQYYWYCLTKRDPYVWGTRPYLFRLSFLSVCLFAFALYLFMLVECLLEGYSPLSLLTQILAALFCLLCCWCYPPMLVRVARRKAYGKGFSRKKQVQSTWLAVARGFVMRPVFWQEVTITREGHTFNAPYPGDPVIHSVRDQLHMRVLLSEHDLYFLQLEPSKQPLPYLFGEGLHFVRRNYAPADWDLLVEKLREMKYLNG